MFSGDMIFTASEAKQIPFPSVPVDVDSSPRSSRTQLDMLQLRNLREILWSTSVIEAHKETTALLLQAEDSMEWTSNRSSEAQEKASLAVAELHHFNIHTSFYLWKKIQNQRLALEQRFQASRVSMASYPVASRESKLALFDDMRELQCLSDYRLAEHKRMIALYMQAMSEQNMALALEIQSIKNYDKAYEKHALLDEHIEQAHRSHPASLLNLIILWSVARQQRL